MKRYKWIALLLCVGVLGTSVSSCGSKNYKPRAQKKGGCNCGF
jgi:hypothetical protein